MEGCPHKPFWQCVAQMRKKLNDHILTLYHSTPMVYQVRPTFGCSKLDFDLKPPQTDTALAGLIEASELSFRSCIMTMQPDSGLVEQQMDGSLST